MSESEEKTVSPTDAFKMMKDEVAVYLDVRTTHEFLEGSPRGSINVPVMNKVDGQMTPNGDFVSQVKEKIKPEQSIFVGCRTGGRSLTACRLLLRAGFKDVSNVVGGFCGTPDALGWSNLDLPIQP